ncbi:hypothetical protein L2X99_14495 [Microbacterium sp. KUDC0406]|uniref:hypothetical protein n=1 Tax=Microbacterium sp. KUDC0406 TaxID=2909588 RepID=UPI001F1B562C|nr:hypothetical protein [Microbacterium sp. KUDC0406]UJP09612.1 hypothetical protein L2X99_14495 [Microbacterium sp. KUDC0406]
MTAATSRRRVPTVAIWGALGVLAWALLVVLLGGGAAHASDRGAPHHDRPAANAQQSGQHGKDSWRASRTAPSAHHTVPSTHRAGGQTAKHIAQATKHAVQRPAPHAPKARKQHSDRGTDRHATVQRTAAQAGTSVKRSSFVPERRTGTVAKPTTITLQPVAFSATGDLRSFTMGSSSPQDDSFAKGEREHSDVLSFHGYQRDQARDATMFSSRDAFRSATSWLTGATSHIASNRDHRVATRDRFDGLRQRVHDRFRSADHGHHRATPERHVHAEPAPRAAVASSWTRAVVGHHADVTAVAAPSTETSYDVSAPSDTSDTEFSIPPAPSAPSTTIAGSASTPLAVAARPSDDLPSQEGTPVRAAEATQSVVHAAPVFTTDVSPD